MFGPVPGTTIKRHDFLDAGREAVQIVALDDDLRRGVWCYLHGRSYHVWESNGVPQGDLETRQFGDRK